MLRIFAPLIFIVLYVAWILYRLIIKKDLKQNLNIIYLGLFFIGIWAILYWLILKD